MSISNPHGKPNLQSVSLESLLDRYVGEQGSVAREKYERELRIDLLGHAIKDAREKRMLTQDQLGELVGVRKAQISKIENSITDARLSTILKVFDALGARVNFTVTL